MQYEWSVIGAGPAGIATVDQLLSAGIAGQNICWVDPAFQVGDFGTYWYQVSSNTIVHTFKKFYAACQTFKNKNKPAFAIEGSDPTKTCSLEVAAEPLHWMTQELTQQVDCLLGTVNRLSIDKQSWRVELAEGQSYLAKNIVLAIGADPQSLHYPNVKEISLKAALNKDTFSQQIEKSDCVALFGSSHSAIMILKKLLDKGVKKIINFYQSPLKYAVSFDDWILFDNTGLKGETADWAKKTLHDALPANLQRVLATPENIQTYLPQCNKAIYAIGFKARKIKIEGFPSEIAYNPRTGIIAPGLFGIGIAFPEAKEDPIGNLEHRVGLWKFMDYLPRILPIWLRYGMGDLS